MFPKEESMSRDLQQKRIQHISFPICNIVSPRFGRKVVLLPPVILLLETNN